MSWIEIKTYKEAGKRLKRLYDKVTGPNGKIDNVLKVHSLRPHTLKGHMALYKAVLHNHKNTLPKWYLEAIGIYVSQLNGCDYCVQHHLAGFKKLTSVKKGESCMRSISNNHLEWYFLEHHVKGLEYARKLTESPDKMTEKDIEELRNLQFTDGAILEVNQVVSYFNYVNRTVSGLGVNTKGDILGLSPNDSSNASNWSHS